MFQIVLSCTKLYWAALSCIELYWAALSYIELHWGVLSCIELYWAVMSCIELFWVALSCIELYLAILSCIELLWADSWSCIELHWLKILLLYGYNAAIWGPPSISWNCKSSLIALSIKRPFGFHIFTPAGASTSHSFVFLLFLVMSVPSSWFVRYSSLICPFLLFDLSVRPLWLVYQ